MDIYHIWADKKGDISDSEWINNMKLFLDQLVQEKKMISYRITRCKMGFRSIGLTRMAHNDGVYRHGSIGTCVSTCSSIRRRPRS